MEDLYHATVVGVENHSGVLGQSQFAQRARQEADRLVDGLHHGRVLRVNERVVGFFFALVLLRQFRARFQRNVHHVRREKEQKRVFRVLLLFQKPDG